MASKLSQPKISPEEKRWRVDSAMNTLRQAEEIKKDKALMKDVRASAQSLVTAVSRMGGTTRAATRKPMKRK